MKSTHKFHRQYFGTNNADMQLISKFNKGILFLLFVADICSKCTWIIPLKDKKRYYNYCFSKKYKKRKTNKMWVDKSSKFDNRSLKSFFQNNNIEIYSTHNKEKSVVAETFIRTLKNKI